MNYAEVILPLSVKGTYTYSVPQGLLNRVKSGMRVLVSFGTKKLYTGIVDKIHGVTPETFVPKDIISVLDETPLFQPQQMSLFRWISEYYICNIGDLFRFFLPSSLKLESGTYVCRNSETDLDLSILDTNEKMLMQALEAKGSLSLNELESFLVRKEMIRTLDTLMAKKLIAIDERIHEKYRPKLVSYVKIAKAILEKTGIQETLKGLERAPKQRELFLTLLSLSTSEEQFPKKSTLLSSGGFSSSELKALVRKNIVEEFSLQTDRLEVYRGKIEAMEDLSDAQKKASEEIERSFMQHKLVLLHGVSSSGKTHIYLEKIRQCITERGKSALLLLPETSLTKQTCWRIKKKFGPQLGFYHNKLSDFEKVEVWRKVKNNELKVLVGTAPVLFLPYVDLGLILVDEEHDSAYRLDTSKFYFNARDTAVMLGNFYDAPVLLGSATPSVETFHAAREGKIGYVRLLQRFGNAAFPKVEWSDLKKNQKPEENAPHFSQALIDEMRENLDEKKQVILFHNRRGYSGFIECTDCGHVPFCSNCDVAMAYHKEDRMLKCHYCGFKAAELLHCPQCNSQHIRKERIGIQQLQEEIREIFPQAVVERMDSDAMRSKFSYERLYEKVENGQVDIILGTQMIAKGLDFDRVDLVAIPSLDSLLYIQDFRAQERAYQLITQLKGRAGRKSGNGKIILQRLNSSLSFFKNISETNDDIYDLLLQERKKFSYPPFVHLAMLEIRDRRESKAQRASEHLAQLLKKHIPSPYLLGPEKAQVSKINNLFRFQILLKIPRHEPVKYYKKVIDSSIGKLIGTSTYRNTIVKTLINY